jgi:DNA modification methylase
MHERDKTKGNGARRSAEPSASRRPARAELVWDGKYDEAGRRVAPLRVTLPFQTVETVNESAQDRQRSLSLGPGFREEEWRNRLIWGDKKYVLPSLLPEFAGKVNLIYIDPPFDTGADFSFTATVPESPDSSDNAEVHFVKEPSIIEQKAYRDIWGAGINSYLQWLSETCMLLKELLEKNGTIYVHVDWRTAHSAKLVLDEVFGSENFLNNIVWEYQTRHSSDRFWNRKHDDLLLYKNSTASDWAFNWKDEDVIQKLSPVTIAKYRLKDEKGYYRLNGRFLKDSPIKGAKDVDPKWERTHPELVVRDYLRSGIPPNDSFFIPIENQSSSDRTDYPTQKPTALLRKLIKASSNKGDIVLDCFVGSGTTAVVAETLGRRWIACDLSRFAIHTSRKRLLSVPGVCPFVVQNLGKYERQLWAGAEFGDNRAAMRHRAYIKFVLKLANATPTAGYSWLHGVRAGRMVHVGAVDAPVSIGDVTQIAAEFRRAVGTGKDAPTTNGVDVLGWDFAFEMNEVAKQQANAANIQMHFLRIPRDVMDKRAVEQGDIRFFELAALSVDVKANKRNVFLKLTDFVIPPDDVPEEARKAVRHWSQWIDYWAVDWDNKGDTFHNEWQTYRTRKDKSLLLETAYSYADPGEYTVVVKVIDILGNDTTKTVKVRVP